ncbi:MAG: uroporphyrinogen-III synthase [Pseudomonadota bacterium]
MVKGAAGALRVVVTRPAHDALPWVEQLHQNGFDAQSLPLMDIAPLTPVVDAAAMMRGHDALMFVSGNAVSHFLTPEIAAPFIGTAMRFMAPGPGTAAALLACGVPASQIDVPPADAGQFDSEALWELVGGRNWPGKRVLVVRGSSAADAPAGRDWLAQQLQAAGATVDFVSVYERRSPQPGPEEQQLAHAAAADGSVWLFSSSEAVHNLTALVAGQSEATVDWRRARAVATHPRIARTLKEAGWGVVVESRPTLNDIVATLRSIESAYP